MDISTVEINLENNNISSKSEFVAAVKKIWNNSYTFNK